MTEAATPGQGWAGIKRAFGTPSALTMAMLGFGSGLPFLLIASQTLSTRLRDVGLDLGSIGLISLASFFYLLKFLWAPLLDRYAFPLLGGSAAAAPGCWCRRCWCWSGWSRWPSCGPSRAWPLVMWVLVASFAGATQDSAVVLPHRDRAADRPGGAGRHLYAGLPDRPDPGRCRRAVPGPVRRLDRRLPGDGRADAAADRHHPAVRRTGTPGHRRAAPHRYCRSVRPAHLQLLQPQWRGTGAGAAGLRRPVQVPRPGDRGDGRAVLSRLGVRQGRHRHRLQAVRCVDGHRRRVPWRHRGGCVRLPPHAAGGRAGRGAVQPGLPADGAQPASCGRSTPRSVPTTCSRALPAPCWWPSCRR